MCVPSGRTGRGLITQTTESPANSGWFTKHNVTFLLRIRLAASAHGRVELSTNGSSVPVQRECDSWGGGLMHSGERQRAPG
jgi:hypothetical protein